MTVRKLRELAAAKAKEAREIKEKVDAEGRGMTEAEDNEYRGHIKEARRIIKEAEGQEELEAVETTLNTPQETKSTPELSTGERIEVPGGVKMYRYGSLRAFKGPKAEVEAYRSGRFLAAAVFGHAASRQWCDLNGVSLRRVSESEDRAMGEGINTAGGFTVPDEFERSVIDLREEYGDARKHCRIKPMGSDHTNEPKKVGGLTAHPVGENVALTESEQIWGNVEMTAKKWGVLTRISNELNDDSLINLADDLASDAALAFATSEDNACIDGDGTGTYHGLVGIRVMMIDGDHVASYVENPGTGDNWSEITAAMLASVMAALPKYAERNAKWHCSKLAKASVFDRLMGAAGGNTNRNLAEPQPDKYMGYPIAQWSAMPSVDAGAVLNGKIMMMFGDMQMSSKLGVRRGITLLVLKERYAEFDQIGLRFIERFSINHHTITGATPASDRGPIVGMLGNT